MGVTYLHDHPHGSELVRSIWGGNERGRTIVAFDPHAPWTSERFLELTPEEAMEYGLALIEAARGKRNHDDDRCLSYGSVS